MSKNGTRDGVFGRPRRPWWHSACCMVQPRCCRPRCRVRHARAYHAKRAGLLAVWPATRFRPRIIIRALCEAYTRGTAPQQTRAWKLFLLAPRLLLHRPREPGTFGRKALLQRSRGFVAGRWDTLLGARAQPRPHHVLAPQPTSWMLPIIMRPFASGGEHSRTPTCGVEKNPSPHP